MRWLVRNPKTENAWTATDRRERLKLVAATLALAGALTGGIAALIYALAER